MIRLTELDLCVLGVIWQWGPLSAYQVRSQFKVSTTAAWSSSAGSIYPSIRRLIGAGLVVAGARQDRRGTRQVAITPNGRDHLRRWIVYLPPELGTAIPDPIRTRAQFITSVRAEDRLRFVENARNMTLTALRAVEAEAEANAESVNWVSDQIGTLGSILALRARLEWLDQVLNLLSMDE